MPQEIKSAVESILGAVGVVVSFDYRGERKDALGGAGSMDEWLCTVTNHAKVERFEYFTGLGHRKCPKAYENTMKRELKEYHSSHATRIKAKYEKPVKPHSADLLHCLITDFSACDYSFANWCNEFSYDTDSRKALETFLACQESGQKLNRVFDRATLQHLREALQDY